MNGNNEIKNSEILLIYEAKLCNPNGDPDDENRPRIDPRTQVNLVSDVRLKRFFRNYLISTFGEEYVWVSTVDGKHVDATERLEKLKAAKELDEEAQKKLVFSNCIDARLFGAVIPIRASRSKKQGLQEKEEEPRESKGQSLSFTGPVQFSWGYSLHPVELVDSASITSVFKGRETTSEAGTIGKDYRVYYSLISFYGVVSSHRAKNTNLQESDVKILDNLIWQSIAQDATTRSKIGHKPHLYLRVEYSEDFFLGDLRKYIEVRYDSSRPIRSLGDLELSFNKLAEKLKTAKVKNVYIIESDEMEGKVANLLDSNAIKLPHKIENIKDLLSRS